MEEITLPHLTYKSKEVPYNTDFDDFYCSKISGIDEARYVFHEGNSLLLRWKNHQNFTIAETGFGTGLSFLSTWQAWRQNPGRCQRLHYISIEKHPLPAQTLQELLSPWPELKPYVDELIAHYPALLTGIHFINLDNGRVQLILCLMDIQTALQELAAKVNCWFLDGFAPAKNPEMWSQAVMQQMIKLSHPEATLATYTAASQVRRNMQAAGWLVTKRPGFGGKREMLTAALPTQHPSNTQYDSIQPLPSKPTVSDCRAALPYQPWYALADFIDLAEKTATVIGGGIAGCQIARALADRNYQVCLIERHPQLAQEASGNPAGIISPKMTAEAGWGERFYRQSFLHVLRQLKQLTAAGLDIEWDACGSLQLNHTAREQKRWHALQQRELPTDFIQFPDATTASTLAGIELPYGGSFFPQAAWVNPQSFCQALVQHPNIKVITETAALKLNQTSQGYQVSTSNPSKRSLPGSHIVIIANGRDASRLLPTDYLPMMAVQGQTSTVQVTAATKLLQVALGHEGYLTPAINGQHVFGATFDRNSSEPLITETATQRNWQQLQQYLPQFTSDPGNPSSAHAAIRMTTPDRYPYVGAIPDEQFYRAAYADLHHGKKHKTYPPANYRSGLFIMTGFGSRGLTTCTLSAELLASLINGEPLPLEKSLYYQLHPARFLVKKLKQRPF